ncbi:MAG: U32 family peptidase [Bacteroidales bacterium]|nr:U32 family peptidase [Bacteroidales bacterium]
MELLSPAKNLETAIAAINCGADAVYIGANDFSARKAAGNSIQDIEKLVNYAHFYKAKVYVTLNTILYNNELSIVNNLIRNLYNIGVDALIIQDLGILEMDIPPIELHASTQMNNFDLQRIKFFDEIGFKRIVLARETPLERIKEIRKSINAEIECFIHGALCVSFSGQCYMSAAIGGRSANRGECAQACRLKYDLLNSRGEVLIKDSYLLSLRDLNMTSHIVEMYSAGVDSLKIEGRLKDKSYVANITAHYRNLIDNILDGKVKKPSSGRPIFDFTPSPDKVFNRKFTDYFAVEPKKGMANFISPKSSGEYLGKVVMVRGNNLKVKTDEVISNGDGLCCVVNGAMYGFRVEKIENGVITANLKEKIATGTDIYRNLDIKFQQKLDNTKTTRKVAVEFTVTLSENGFTIIALDEDNIECECFTQFQLQKADNQERAFNSITNSLSKCGERFECKRITFDFDESPFIPNSVINEARRNVLQMLEQKRIKSFHPKDSPKPSGNAPYFETEGGYRLNVSNRLAKEFYKKHGCNVAQQAFELQNFTKGLELMTTRYCIRRELGYCLKNQGVMPDKWKCDEYRLVSSYGSFALKFDCKECFMRVFNR